MKILETILDYSIAIYSKQMRETLELGKLNDLWERFNNGEDVREELLKHKWKYHAKKVLLLFTCHELKDRYSKE